LSQTEAGFSPRKAVVPVVAITALALVVLLSNRPAVSPEGVPIVGNGDQYADVLSQVKQLTEGPIRKSNMGEPLSPEELVDLRHAAGLVDSLNAFQPTIFAPYLLAAKVYQLLGKTETAEQRVRQSILNGNAELKACLDNKDIRRADEVRLTLTEAHYVRSVLLVQMREYSIALDEANAVIESVPNSPTYLSARASALVQLNRVAEAKRDIAAALKLDPNHKTSLALKQLIESR